MVGQSDGHARRDCSRLQRGMNQGLPQHWLPTQGSPSAGGQPSHSPGHGAVMLHEVLLHDSTTTTPWAGL